MTRPIRALFLHDSASRRLLTDGNIRTRLGMQGPPVHPIELWDYDYCKHVLHDGDDVPHKHISLLDGEIAGPAAFRRLFRGRDPEARAALLEALEFDVIALGAGHRASTIANDLELYRLKSAYKWLFAALAALPREFVVLTSPPLPLLRTEEAKAERARDLADWLAGDIAGWYDNVAVLDLFDLLSERDGAQANRLPKRFRTGPLYSRLNSRGAYVAGLALASAIAVAAERCPCPEPTARHVVTELVAGTPRGVS